MGYCGRKASLMIDSSEIVLKAKTVTEKNVYLRLNYYSIVQTKIYG